MLFFYIGSSDARLVRAADWDSVGATGEPDTVWNRANGWGIDESLFNTAARNWLLQQDDFVRAAADPLERTSGSSNTSNNSSLNVAQADARYARLGEVELIIRYNGVQPLRETVTNDPTQRVRWISPTAPAVADGYAIAGVDVWENSN